MPHHDDMSHVTRDTSENMECRPTPTRANVHATGMICDMTSTAGPPPPLPDEAYPARHVVVLD